MADTFIKFDGVDGESQQEGYKNWIEISDWSVSAFAAHSSDVGGGSGVGKPSYQPVTVNAVAGKHSPLLYKKFNEGKHFDLVEVISLKQTGSDKAEKFYHCTMKHVFITGMAYTRFTDTQGSESISFKFEEIKQEYWTQDSKGKLTSVGSMTYNNKTNKSA